MSNLKRVQNVNKSKSHYCPDCKRKKKRNYNGFPTVSAKIEREKDLGAITRGREMESFLRKPRFYSDQMVL